MSRHYFDHNATTPMLPEAAEAYARGAFGNPSSLHWAGRAARAAVEDAREMLAGWLGVSPGEIVFCAGGTEADNLALLGAADSGKLRGCHIVAASFEHPAVLEPIGKLAAAGWEVTWVDPDRDGVVRPAAVAAALRPDTALATVMAANNETGALQPVAEIGALLRDRGVPFHCDAVQALGKSEVRPRDWQTDYVALSAHKINGPKGVGALYVRKGAPLAARSLGGPQERKLRGGTENAPGIAAFGAAAAWWRGHADAERVRLAALRDALTLALKQRIPDLIVNAERSPRVPNTLNLTLPGCRSDLMVMALDMREVAVSAGSACASGAVQHSHVLLSMGLGKEAASTALRFSMGLGNTLEEIGPCADRVAEAATAVRGT
ncbi:MAG: cysteine desulfurase [Fibrobacteres bacterium]|nr:cysteine desulfurase [Fibrobacterota bacterium]